MKCWFLTTSSSLYLDIFSFSLSSAGNTCVILPVPNMKHWTRSQTSACQSIVQQPVPVPMLVLIASVCECKLLARLDVRVHNFAAVKALNNARRSTAPLVIFWVPTDVPRVIAMHVMDPMPHGEAGVEVVCSLHVSFASKPCCCFAVAWRLLL